MIIIYLRDPKSSIEFKIRIQIRSFYVLYNVDLLVQSAFFEKLLESNQTLLPKYNLFLLTCSTSVQIYKNY
jgi:hypothetical protein